MLRRLLLTSICVFCMHLAWTQDTATLSSMTQVAGDFVGTLSAGQRREGLLDFRDPVRTDWSNEPLNLHPRKGIRLDKMTDTQKKTVHRLLETVLSEQGYLKVLNVLRLDDWLKRHYYKGADTAFYGDGLYWLTIFGQPAPHHAWGWRFEGHHLSINITVSGQGEIRATPFFLGSHPGVIPSGPYAGAENLFMETRLGWELMESLNPEEQKQAIVSTEEPKGGDILIRTGHEPETKTITGIPVISLNQHQQQLVGRLIGCYVNNLAPALADYYLNLLHQKEWSGLHFVWMGQKQPGKAIYYRLQSPDGFIIEYCNRLHDPVHIHTFWRWLPEDFGGKTPGS